MMAMSIVIIKIYEGLGEKAELETRNTIYQRQVEACLLYTSSASVSPVKCIRPWNASENSLYQNIKRVCAKVCLNKKDNPQMGYRQTKNKQNDLFDFLRKCHSR